jgi:SHS2 domain-containing protein
MEFEEIEHTADIALRVHGNNIEALLINAARGMNRLILNDNTSVSTEIKKNVALEAVDTESLLVEWLSELAYWAETEMLIFKKFNLHNISSTHLQATLIGGKVPKLDKHIKAVTYHNLKIIETEHGLETTIVFDV